MSLLEDRILRIIELRQAGKDNEAIARSLKIPAAMVQKYEQSAKQDLQEILTDEKIQTLGEIADELRMSRTVTGMAMEYFGLHISEKSHRVNPHSADIARLAEEGKTRREIAQELGLSYGSVRTIAQQESIAITPAYRGRKGMVSFERPRVRPKPSEQALTIQTALNKGERSLEVLVREAQCGLIKFHDICRDYHITLPDDIIPYRSRSEFDAGIARGDSINKIAIATGKSRQLIHIYIKRSGQQYFWEKQKAERKQQGRQELEDEKDEQRNALYQMEEKIRAMAKEQGWAYEKMVEYDFSRQKNVANIPLETLLHFFQRYETAQSEGKKLSLKKLSRGLFGMAMAGRLLEDVGLKPLYGNWDTPSREVTQQKKELILRAASTPLSAADLEYFTGIPAHSIGQYILKEGEREQKASTAGIKSFDYKKTKEILTYRLASEIYEARDCGFTPEDTIFLLDSQQQVVEYALEHEKKISKTIINALQNLYPEKSITKPYLLRAELPVFRDVKQDAMQRAFEQLPWTAIAISYFLEVDCQQVHTYYQKQGGKRTQRSLKNFGQVGQLTIPTASQVYELKDRGLQEKAIQRRLHQSQQVVDYALQHRAEIEPEIINGLQVLFPQEKIMKPYR